jgi:hypothetical protein
MLKIYLSAERIREQGVRNLEAGRQDEWMGGCRELQGAAGILDQGAVDGPGVSLGDAESRNTVTNVSRVREVRRA